MPNIGEIRVGPLHLVAQIGICVIAVMALGFDASMPVPKGMPWWRFDSRVSKAVHDSIDTRQFRVAEQADTVDAYRKYIADYPNGLHQREASAKMDIDTRQFRVAEQADTVDAYRKYIADYPNGLHQREASEKMDDAAFRDAGQKPDLAKAYQVYVQQFPNGRHVADALQRRAVDLDDRSWASATVTNTSSAYQAYLQAHPDGQFVQQARLALVALGLSTTGKAQAEAQTVAPSQQAVTAAPSKGECRVSSSADVRAGPSANEWHIRVITRDDVLRVIGKSIGNDGLSWTHVSGSWGEGWVLSMLLDCSEAGTTPAEAAPTTPQRATDEAAAQQPAQQSAEQKARPEAQTVVPSQPAVAAAVETALALSPARWVLIQRSLAALGYQVGSADGLPGDRTRAAIRRFQHQQRSLETGYLDAQELRELLAETHEALERDDAQRAAAAAAQAPPAPSVNNAKGMNAELRSGTNQPEPVGGRQPPARSDAAGVTRESIQPTRTVSAPTPLPTESAIPIGMIKCLLPRGQEQIMSLVQCRSEAGINLTGH